MAATVNSSTVVSKLDVAIEETRTNLVKLCRAKNVLLGKPDSGPLPEFGTVPGLDIAMQLKHLVGTQPRKPGRKPVSPEVRARLSAIMKRRWSVDERTGAPVYTAPKKRGRPLGSKNKVRNSK